MQKVWKCKPIFIVPHNEAQNNTKLAPLEQWQAYNATSGDSADSYAVRHRYSLTFDTELCHSVHRRSFTMFDHSATEIVTFCTEGVSFERTMFFFLERVKVK